MLTNGCDVLVIGCGPAGSAAATFLAKAGYKVIVLEKEYFPRFHIGESLLPYNRSIFEEMGVWPELAAAGFPRKLGAQFHMGNGIRKRRFIFSQGAFTRQTEAIQVERSIFDHILMKHARQCGAEVREGWTVRGYRSADRQSRSPSSGGGDKEAGPADTIHLKVGDPQGQEHELTAKFVVDASGRHNLTGNQDGLKSMYPQLKKMSVFRHFTGVKLDSGPSGGDTVMVCMDNKWFWFIPISATKTSVGLVIDKSEFAADKRSPEEIFAHWVGQSAVARRRMEQAQPVGDTHTTSDYSYLNQRLVERRLVRVGDAAGFMDPIFSTGVFLAMRSAKMAAEVIGQALAEGHDGARLLARYEKQTREGMNYYLRLVEGFYTSPFLEIFMQPRNNLGLTAAVNAVLAGEMEGGWRVYWRLMAFFGLVALQKVYPVVPRLSFDAAAKAADPFAFLARTKP